MPETCKACGGTGSVLTPHEKMVAKMGENAADLVKAGYDAIAVTGNPFTLKGDRYVYLPKFDAIQAPKGVEFNDRYAWLIGVFLRDGAHPDVVEG